MEIVVRNYYDGDLEFVNEILEEAFEVKKDNFTYDYCREVVACVDDRVCGYLLMTKVFNPVLGKYYFLIDYVSVLTSYRNMGIGKKMLSYAEEIARREEAIYLQLTCGYKRVEAHKLYESYGFKKRESDLFRKELV